MCYNPRWITKKGFRKENSFRGYAGEYYELGTYGKCGVCSQCIAEKSTNWVVRNYFECKGYELNNSYNACFITLTYENNPIFLVRKDFQDFIKRFRFKINESYYKKLRNVKKFLNTEALELWKIDHEKEFVKTRIFYAGEYGEKNGRPHFHAIIYGWKDENTKYLGASGKSKLPLYQSKIIQNTWGLGRTSYQDFTENKEAIYLSLYQTAGEAFKRAYKLSKEKVKKLKAFCKANLNSSQYKNLLSELIEREKEMEENRQEWLAIREFNGWSQSLGWNEFEKEYLNNEINTFDVYIEDKIVPCPISWLKKLANQYGDVSAANEILRREEDLYTAASEEEERMRNLERTSYKRKKEILDHAIDRKNEEITVI